MRRVFLMVPAFISLGVFTLPAFAQRNPTSRCDSSAEAIARDEASLRETIKEALAFLAVRDGGRKDARRPARRLPLEKIYRSIEVEFVGTGELVPIPSADDLPNRPPADVKLPEPPDSLEEWVGVNPATCNQFRMRIPGEVSDVLGKAADAKGIGRANEGRDTLTRIPPWDWKVVFEEQFVPPNTGPFFSQCIDTRMRADSFHWPERTVSGFSRDGEGTSCTGTLVGPRHVVTAAHCVFGGGNTWHDFHVIPGRNGTEWPYGSAHMSDTEGLNQGFRWYWIPAAVVDNTYAWYQGFDIAILILPQRLGDVAGWMGTAARSENALGSVYHRNLGYPAQPGLPIGYHPIQLEGALYGDLNQCNVGDYDHYDNQGWARQANHACDSSSGHSGGPIYHWFFDPPNGSWPAVSLIISSHPAFENDFDCPNNPRPYHATRLTPEYVNQLKFM